MSERVPEACEACLFPSQTRSRIHEKQLPQIRSEGRSSEDRVPLLNIKFRNAFHDTSAELSFFTSRQDTLKFTGRQLRRLLSEVCPVVGCDCFRDIEVFVDGRSAIVRWIDIDADEEKPAIEIELPTPE
ncbi:MAG: hypothetical protein WA705_07365 [Candidatus Ozemobacteraceae bacterium]